VCDVEEVFGEGDTCGGAEFVFDSTYNYKKERKEEEGVVPLVQSSFFIMLLDLHGGGCGD